MNEHPIATCLSVGVYRLALKRGQKYNIISINEPNGLIKVCGDNGQTRWFPITHFDFSQNFVPVLGKWWFMDSPRKSQQADIGFQLNDGTCRYCIFVTPSYLEAALGVPNEEPGLWYPHMIIVQEVTEDTVAYMLNYLNDQGNLIEASKFSGLVEDLTSPP